jgi:hypothetical protein
MAVAAVHQAAVVQAATGKAVNLIHKKSDFSSRFLKGLLVDQLEQNSQLSSPATVSCNLRCASASICSGDQSGLAILIIAFIKLLFG